MQGPPETNVLPTDAEEGVELAWGEQVSPSVYACTWDPSLSCIKLASKCSPDLHPSLLAHPTSLAQRSTRYRKTAEPRNA